MSSPAAFGQWQGYGSGTQPSPQLLTTNNESMEDGITIKPMRLKVLYTFDDQNKTNCLARWPHILQIQTVSLEEGATIGVIELKTCVQAVLQCSPELATRIGQDYTVYAYDYSEYDNPLVGQGMLSRVLQATSLAPEVPAQQSRQLITGRVCKNILGLFNNGVKETLEVKLRLVPVPTSLQNEYQNTMEKFRETTRSVPPPGYDPLEWNSLIQSTPNFSQAPGRSSMPPNPHNPNHPPKPNPTLHQRDGISMEVVNQLLSPGIQEQPNSNSFNQQPALQNTTTPIPAVTESLQEATTMATKTKKPTSRPASRAAVKRPKKPKTSTTSAAGGNTSGYEEGTDGDDGPAPKKRAKTTKATAYNQRNSFASAPDSLRVAASTAGSLRLFRPIAMSPALPPAGDNLQEIPRVPTPVPRLPQNQLYNQQTGQSNLRRESFAQEPTFPPSRTTSPFTLLSQSQDELRFSIESVGPSPERHDSPADTPPEFNSSPPVLRTRPPSLIRSSPPCPTSPCLPQMPRTDSGFMSGSLEELFGEDDQGLCPIDDYDEVDIISVPEKTSVNQSSIARTHQALQVFREEFPGPVELLPTRMPVLEPPKIVKPKQGKPKTGMYKAARSRGGSVLSEDGALSLPPLRNGNQPAPSGLQSQHSREMVQQPLNYVPSYQSMSHPPRILSHAPVQQQFSGAQQPITQMPVNSPYANIPQQALAPEQTIAQQSQNQQAPVHQPHQPPIVQGQPKTQIQTPRMPETRGKGRQPSVPSGSAPPPEQRRTMARTASVGSLTLPHVPASDPVLPPSSLHRSQTWSEAPHPVTEGPMPVMHDMQQMIQGSLPAGIITTAPGVPYSRTWNAKKAAIRHRLELAIANGEMPPFCCNCGAIETPTWRKAWSQDCQGAPGYHEYSDEPGRVTAIIILTRDSASNPTSFQIIKKSLSVEDNPEDFKEYVLCNPCGIWMSKYKTARPSEKWENNGPVEKKPPAEKRRPQQRPARPRRSAAGQGSEPPVEFNHQNQTDGPSPTDTTGVTQMDQPQERQRSTSARPPKRLNAMTSDAASAALRRALQSSPARWNGTRHSPIELEDDDSTRRLLFPSPRKDGSPKVLGEMTTNIVQISASYDKEQIAEIPNKENYPPITIDEDDAFLKLFEEEMARPTTPNQKTPPTNPFKTPTRPSPNHRPVTRSVSKSARKSPGLFLGSTPLKTPRRSPRNHNNAFVSPFTATLSQMMSEANEHAKARPPPAHNGMELDFENLPDLPLADHANLDSTFNLEDFFSTDVPMPSSPPRAFRLYEDPMSLNAINWDEFQSFSEQSLGAGALQDKVIVKEEPQDSPQMDSGNEAPEKKSA